MILARGYQRRAPTVALHSRDNRWKNSRLDDEDKFLDNLNPTPVIAGHRGAANGASSQEKFFDHLAQVIGAVQQDGVRFGKTLADVLLMREPNSIAISSLSRRPRNSSSEEIPSFL
jgi:hypothetical protein